MAKIKSLQDSFQRVELIKQYQLLVALSNDFSQLDPSESDYLAYEASKVYLKLNFLFN
ncbi:MULTISPECIES: hypothetical protein [Mesonia]|uniref:Uncharacterized protein n=1 Tax=Mesonia oceanica TaxID=2687242 RepID=A0AC61YD11_9FLAO|nr:MULTISPECIES: hypothetical protein [Mesonia]VVV02399.1 hypothetical protein FVB9532_03698 [Mesonia oceanica]|tara:strand:+ start:2122 stop:2295 length:174 start_codon:yes stop_codon:yes gene_type:complete